MTGSIKLLMVTGGSLPVYAFLAILLVTLAVLFISIMIFESRESKDNRFINRSEDS